ncbi:class I SAM-dependent methyltransferase family protein [Halostella sp. JP-L12]|uniref:class I SAM-dependent methyltransferase n=1 Tax=Halostella TaxID=1843185 RepID=UPI000EF81C27|nr:MULTISPECIES: class I SAM-dependent methyltransferase family protein [Halostella]NHN48739.1 class I SAM-dependent methyltransferase family protein [Halostella sp. JP-L12]
MEAPCVRVPREDGEATRRALADDDLVAEDLEIEFEEGHLYIPVTDAAAVPDEYDVVVRDVAERDVQVMPTELLGFDPSYERLGDIVIVDEDDPARARAVADAVVESDIPVKTVVNRASKIEGELRIRDWDVLAGEETETVHREYGCEYALDIAEMYFSPRLATERHRVTEQVEAGERVFDMFAGVGPFVVPAAKRGAEVVGVDLNERAVEYLRENAERNGVADRVTAIAGDVRDVAPDYENWADRVVMNLPHSADEFLDAAVAVAGDDCVLHYYDIQHEDDPYGPGERAIRDAAAPEYEVTVETGRTVRSYAPHEVNVCLDVRLSR